MIQALFSVKSICDCSIRLCVTVLEYRIVKKFGSKKVWRMPSLKRFGEKTLAIPIIITKVFSAMCCRIRTSYELISVLRSFLSRVTYTFSVVDKFKKCKAAVLNDAIDQLQMGV